MSRLGLLLCALLGHHYSLRTSVDSWTGTTIRYCRRCKLWRGDPRADPTR